MIIVKRTIFILTLVAFILELAPAFAQLQDSILTFQEAKARLFKKNLKIISAYYGIDIARADVIRARTWNNPNFVFNGDMYSVEKNKYFASQYQTLLQLEQTISISGKRTQSVKLAKLGVTRAEKEMENTLRGLLFELGNHYADFAALQENGRIYRQMLQGYAHLMRAVRKQLEIGAISLSESIRLESEYLAIRTDSLENHLKIIEEENQLRTLLAIPQDSSIIHAQQYAPLTHEKLSLSELTEKALAIRPDYLLKKNDIAAKERNLKLQRAAVIPDIKLGYQPVDLGSNYRRPYSGFVVEVFLPIFDRNQGKIRAAQWEIKQSSVEKIQLENQIINEIACAYGRWEKTASGLVNYTQQFIKNIDQLNVNVRENFKKRNISLLEFIDQQHIYVKTQTQFIELKRQYQRNINELNFYIGTNIIEY